MTKEQFDKEVQAHVSRFIRDADAKEDARIAEKKLAKHQAKAAKTNSLNRSSMSTLLHPKDAGTKIAESIISSIEAKYRLSEEHSSFTTTNSLANAIGIAHKLHQRRRNEVGFPIWKKGDDFLVQQRKSDISDSGWEHVATRFPQHTEVHNKDVAYKHFGESSEVADDVWCKTCHGEGKNGVKAIDQETGNPDYYEGRCLDCNGTGKRQAKTNQASQN